MVKLHGLKSFFNRVLQKNSVTINVDKNSTVSIGELTAGNKEVSFGENDTSDVIKESPYQYSLDHDSVDLSLEKNNSFLADKIKEAEEFQRRWKFDHAIEIYIDVLASDPPPNLKRLTFVNIAICYLNTIELSDNYSKSEKYINKAKEIFCDDYIEKVFYVEALLHFHKGDHKNALVYLNKAIETAPSYTKAINIKALVREKLGDDVSEVLQDTFFDENHNVKSEYKNDAFSLKTISQLLLIEKDYDKAIAFLNNALEINHDDIVLHSFLGDAYLFKGTIEYHDKEIEYSSENIKLIQQSLKSYKKASEIGDTNKVPEQVRYFLVNYSAALLYLGKHKEAYEKVNKAINLGVIGDELYINKARLETVFGRYDEALESYGNVSDKNDQLEKAHLYFIADRYDDCIKCLDNILSREKSNRELYNIAQTLLAECYNEKNRPHKALEILLELSRSDQNFWQLSVAWANYYFNANEIGKCLEYIHLSSSFVKYYPQALIDIVNLFGKIEEYNEIIKTLNDFKEHDAYKQDSFKRFVFKNLAKAEFFLGNHSNVIHIVKESIKEESYSKSIQDYLIESYRIVGNYTEIKKILNETGHTGRLSPKDMMFLGQCNILTGQVEKGIANIKDAISNDQSLLEKSFAHIALGQAYILLGDNDTALKHSSIAKDLDSDIPKSPAHAFFMQTNLICGKTDNTAQYMMEFHQTFPKQSTVQTIKSMVKDSEGNEQLSPELVEFFTTQTESFNQNIQNYQKNNWPLCVLSNMFNQRLDSVYEWRNIYGIKINIGVGSPKRLDEEIKASIDCSEIVVDYLSLLIFDNLGLLEVVVKCFQKIFISHSTLEDIVNSILIDQVQSTINIWKQIRNEPKVILFTDEQHSKSIEKEVTDIVGLSVSESCTYSIKKNITFCVGDIYIRELFKTTGVVSIGPTAVMYKLLHAKFISTTEYINCKYKLITENHHFISFRHSDLVLLSKDNEYRCSGKCEVFFEYLLKSDPDVDSFVKVYLESIIAVYSLTSDFKKLISWIEIYTTTFCRLYKKNLFRNYEYIKNRHKGQYKSSNDFMGSLTPPEMALMQLLVILHTLSIDHKEKKQLTSVIAENISNANLFILFNNEMVHRAKSISKNIIEENHKYKVNN